MQLTWLHSIFAVVGLQVWALRVKKFCPRWTEDLSYNSISKSIYVIQSLSGFKSIHRPKDGSKSHILTKSPQIDWGILQQ